MKLRYLLVFCAAALLLGCVKVPETPKLSMQAPVVGEEEVWVSKDNAGKPVLVAFMASFCGYCKMSLPHLDAATKEFKDKDVEIIGVFVDPEEEVIAKLVDDLDIESKILYNGGEAAQAMGVSGFPQIYLFDKKHRLVKAWSGFSPNLKEEYSAEINKVL